MLSDPVRGRPMRLWLRIATYIRVPARLKSRLKRAAGLKKTWSRSGVRHHRERMAYLQNPSDTQVQRSWRRSSHLVGTESHPPFAPSWNASSSAVARHSIHPWSLFGEHTRNQPAAITHVKQQQLAASSRLLLERPRLPA